MKHDAKLLQIFDTYKNMTKSLKNNRFCDGRTVIAVG